MRFDAAPHDVEDPQLNVTPMVDMVFTLLAFFVLTATFVRERDLALGAEQPVQAAADAKSGDLPERVVVRLAPGPSSEAVSLSIGQMALPQGAFAQITAKLAEVNLPSVPVVIASDRRVHIGHVARAIDAVLASPMKRLSLSELDPPESSEP